jgi:phosphoribosylaminoimidazolecarboxamide formyltransferase/IMP cyclohydrolase
MVKIKRALISVSDKTGIVDLAKVLKEYGVEIISTGGTAKTLKEAGISVVDVSDVTGFPEMLDGRVKTLHPKIHGGLLALRDKKEHMEQLQKYGINVIDMVVVNLYPFTKTISRPDVKLEDAIENIDIGGPSMIRSAAKNFNSVIVIVNPKFYPLVIEELKKNNGAVSEELRKKMMIEAFKHTYDYDRNIYNFFAQKFLNQDMPDVFNLSYKKVQGLRYGENPHQKGAFYTDENLEEPSISTALQLHGKELSYNNIMDANAAIEIVKEFKEPASVIIKHTNPCGVAIGESIDESFLKAYEADPLSAFGGIIALNREVTVKIAEYISTKFVEIVIAPKYNENALFILKKKKDIRLLEIKGLDNIKVRNKEYDLRKVVGGLLIQDRDLKEITESDLKVVTKKAPSKDEIKDLLFGWKVVKHVKSNAIVVVKDGVTLGVGAGQMNRVGSVKIAVDYAGEKARGACLASDAMFPKPDAIEIAAQAGIVSIIQTGGSIKDKEVIETADKYGLSMVFTGVRHFKH